MNEDALGTGNRCEHLWEEAMFVVTVADRRGSGHVS